VDPAARPKLLELDRRPVESTSRWAGTTWAPGVQLTVGPVVLTLAEIQPPDASLSPSPTGGTLDFNRPPRLLPPPRMTDFALPTEPQKPHRQTFPLLMMTLPMIGSVALAVIMRQPTMLLFGLLTPLMYVGQYFQSKREGKTSYRQDLTEYRARRARVERDARRALAAERTARRRDLPDAASLLLLATGPRSRLWERRPTDPDWLELRLGTADLPSEVMVDDSRRPESRSPPKSSPSSPSIQAACTPACSPHQSGPEASPPKFEMQPCNVSGNGLVPTPKAGTICAATAPAGYTWDPRWPSTGIASANWFDAAEPRRPPGTNENSSAERCIWSVDRSSVAVRRAPTPGSPVSIWNASSPTLSHRRRTAWPSCQSATTTQRERPTPHAPGSG
jgi:hypothetical protein